jgi:CheY-like chemotaxis protein
MSSEVRSRAFEPFFTTKSAGKGTGLGLATVYGIVGQSGGEISLETAPGAGTTMRVCLPVLEREAAARTEETAPRPTGGRETVLAVEDEEAVRRIVCFTLESQGYTVLEARNGQEALDLAGMHDGPIELLVTDVVMPSMSGPELARILSARRPETRVLYVSGYTDDAMLRHGIAVGKDQLLQKPFSPISLLRVVRATLDGAHGEPEGADA